VDAFRINRPVVIAEASAGPLPSGLAFRSHVRVLLRNKLQRRIIGEKAHLRRLRRSRVMRGTPHAPDTHAHDEHSSADSYEVFGHLLGLHTGCQAFKIRAGLAGHYAYDTRQFPGASSPRQNKFRRSMGFRRHIAGTGGQSCRRAPRQHRLPRAPSSSPRENSGIPRWSWRCGRSRARRSDRT